MAWASGTRPLRKGSRQGSPWTYLRFRSSHSRFSLWATPMVTRRTILKFGWLGAWLRGAPLLSAAACQWGEPPTTTQAKTELPEQSPQPSGPPLFQDVTAKAGIEHTYRN